MAKDILLTTLNSSYAHCAFGLRYLFAGLKELQSSAALVEFTIEQKPADIVEILLSHNPKVIGFGVYIWNTAQTRDVVAILRRVRPDIFVVLGGPEVSYETKTQALYALSDTIICGEGEELFYETCRRYLESGEKPEKILSGPLPAIDKLPLPYAFYTDEDIRHRVIYVEASRGCPYKCEFCLSSLDTMVRHFPIDVFLGEMQTLLDRGVRRFKFVDRTFNLNITISRRILQFFLNQIELGLFLHFEMIPDRLPIELRDLIRQFPEGALQFEIGIQTWNPEVAALVSRRQDYGKVKENFAFLKSETKVHTHADLIAGLPGETLDSFAAGFDAVSLLSPDEIQVGILKRLKGTPIIRHDESWEMVYQDHPPFVVLKTKTMDFAVLQSISRFSKFWDLYANSGNFLNTMALLRGLVKDGSLFWEFYRFSQFLETRHPKRYAIALLSLVESAWLYLATERGIERELVRAALIKDYTGYVKRDVPSFLRNEAFPPAKPVSLNKRPNHSAIPTRQQRHLAPLPFVE